MLYTSQIPLVNVHIYFCSSTNSHLVSFTLKFLFRLQGSVQLLMLLCMTGSLHSWRSEAQTIR